MTPTTKALRDILINAVAVIDAGAVDVVKLEVEDEREHRVSFTLVASRVEPAPPQLSSPPAKRLREGGDCPECNAKASITDGGKTPGLPAGSPPTLDLLCVACQHVWQVPLDLDAPKE